MEAVMGIDLGTSYFKVAVVSRQGTMLGLGRRPVPVASPAAEYRELPLTQFIETLQSTIRDALVSAAVNAADVQAVSYSSQANTFTLMDASMRSLTPLIIWSDERVTSPTPEVQRFVELPHLLQRTGLGLFSNQMCVAKLGWLRRSEPAIWCDTRFVVTISDLLIYLLTGHLWGDSSTASLLGIWDVVGECYWTDALECLELRPEMFTSLKRPGTVVGRAHGELSRRAGLSHDAVIVAGSLDHAAAAVGAGIGYLGQASESTGTVLAALGVIDRFVPEEGASVGPFARTGCFYKVAFSEHGAGVLEWYRRTHAANMSLKQLTQLAANVSPGCDGLTARRDADRYPGLNGFQSRPTEQCRHGEGHFFRALLERLAFELRDLLASSLNGVVPSSVVATGGGARNDLWLQIKADVVGCDFMRCGTAEPGAFGGAIYAACGAGWFSGVDEAMRQWVSMTSRFSPNPTRMQQYRRLKPGA